METGSSAGDAAAGDQARPGGAGRLASREREQRDQSERRDVEHVPLLDPLHRRLGGERGDLDEQEDARPGATPPRMPARRAAASGRESHEREQRREGDHADVEVELGDVVEQIRGDLVRRSSRWFVAAR